MKRALGFAAMGMFSIWYRENTSTIQRTGASSFVMNAPLPRGAHLQSIADGFVRAAIR